MTRLADDFARLRLNEARHAAESAGASDTRPFVTAALDRFLYQECQFTLPHYGRSNVPQQSVVDHPGVWENPRLAYLHEVLVCRRGIASSIAVIYAEVMRRLLMRGHIDFAVRMDCGSFGELPRAHVLDIPHHMLRMGEGEVMRDAKSRIALELT